MNDWHHTILARKLREKKQLPVNVPDKKRNMKTNKQTKPLKRRLCQGPKSDVTTKKKINVIMSGLYLQTQIYTRGIMVTKVNLILQTSPDWIWIEKKKKNSHKLWKRLRIHLNKFKSYPYKLWRLVFRKFKWHKLRGGKKTRRNWIDIAPLW